MEKVLIKDNETTIDKNAQQVLSLRFDDVDLLKCSDDKFMEVFEKEPIQLAKQCTSSNYSKFNDIHNQWILSCQNCANMFTILAHRGSYKSTTLRFFLLFEMIRNPKRSYLYLHSIEPYAYTAMRDMAMMGSNKVIKRLVQILYKIEDFRVKPHKAGLETNLPYKASNSDYNVDANGILNTLTGRHYDVIVTDDIVNLKDREGEGKRTSTTRAFREVAACILNRTEEGEEPTKIINIGTPWHPEDAISLEMCKKDDATRTYLKWDCFHTGLLSFEQIAKIKKDLEYDPDTFSINYLLKHSNSKDLPFRHVKYIQDLDYEDFKGGMMHIDISFKGKRHGKQLGDYTAVTIVKKALDENDNEIIYACGKLFASIHDFDFKRKLAQLYYETGVKALYAEGRGKSLGAVMETVVDNIHKEYDVKINLKLYNETDSKKNKARFVTYFWNRLYFDSRHTDKDYLSQLKSWSTAYNIRHDDAFDSLASSLRALKDSSSAKVITGMRLL